MPAPAGASAGIPPALAAAATAARDFFTALGVTEAEGNGPIEFRVDPASHDAAYRADLTLAPDGTGSLANERVEIGTDPFTGAPFWQAPDVVYHELTHRVAAHLVPGFGVTPTSRIVDESLADTFAAAIEGNWTLGEGLVPGGLRSSADPSSQLMLDGATRVHVATPTRVDEMTADSLAKGPYFNIGPLNHAAYLVGEALGTGLMARIYLEALRHHLPAAAGVTDLVLGTVRGAGTLFGAGSAEQLAVRDAWKSVGVRAAAVDSIT
ncbi:MAG: flagellar biosynthesis protein FlgM [Thermoleophilia bacterium]|nr:flagellar biosynthesis protein FlgM [Thermoleophilia bacterium]